MERYSNSNSLRSKDIITKKPYLVLRQKYLKCSEFHNIIKLTTKNFSLPTPHSYWVVCKDLTTCYFKHSSN